MNGGLSDGNKVKQIKTLEQLHASSNKSRNIDGKWWEMFWLQDNYYFAPIKRRPPPTHAHSSHIHLVRIARLSGYGFYYRRRHRIVIAVACGGWPNKEMQRHCNNNNIPKQTQTNTHTLAPKHNWQVKTQLLLKCDVLRHMHRRQPTDRRTHTHTPSQAIWMPNYGRLQKRREHIRDRKCFVFNCSNDNVRITGIKTLRLSRALHLSAIRQLLACAATEKCRSNAKVYDTKRGMFGKVYQARVDRAHTQQELAI